MKTTAELFNQAYAGICQAADEINSIEGKNAPEAKVRLIGECLREANAAWMEFERRAKGNPPPKSGD